MPKWKLTRDNVLFQYDELGALSKRNHIYQALSTQRRHNNRFIKVFYKKSFVKNEDDLKSFQSHSQSLSTSYNLSLHGKSRICPVKELTETKQTLIPFRIKFQLEWKVTVNQKTLSQAKKANKLKIIIWQPEKS